MNAQIPKRKKTHRRTLTGEMESVGCVRWRETHDSLFAALARCRPGHRSGRSGLSSFQGWDVIGMMTATCRLPNPGDEGVSRVPPVTVTVSPMCSRTPFPRRRSRAAHHRRGGDKCPAYVLLHCVLHPLACGFTWVRGRHALLLYLTCGNHSCERARGPCFLCRACQGLVGLCVQALAKRTL